MRKMSLIKTFSLAALLLFASCQGDDDQNDDDLNNVSCELDFESTPIENDSENEADYIFEANELESDSNVIYTWTVDGVNVEESSNTLKHVFIENGTYTVCVFSETPECPDGVESCQDIVVEGLPPIGTDCPSISFDSVIDNDTYSFTTSANFDTEAEYTWNINGDIITNGTTVQNSNNITYKFPFNGTYEVCVSIVTPDCTFGSDACQTIEVTNVNNCPEISFETTLQNSVYNFTASSDIDLDSRYVWFVNNEFIENDTTIENSNQFTYDFPENGTYEICVSIETPDCPLGVTYCDTIEVANVDDATTVFDIFATTPVQDKTLEACADLTYDYQRSFGNAVLLIASHNQGLAIDGSFSWSINGQFIGSGEVIEYEFLDRGNYTICVFLETPECPNGVSSCREFIVE